MRIHWWHSLRTRFMIGSALLALLTTTLLSLISITVINYYYGTDQQTTLSSDADITAHDIGNDFSHNKLLRRSAELSLSASREIERKDDEILQRNWYIVLKVGRIPGTAATHYRPTLSLTTVYPNISVLKGPTLIDKLLKFINPSIKPEDATKMNQAVKTAISGRSVDESFGSNNLIRPQQPFIVRPIFADEQRDAQVIGVLIVTPHQQNITPFVTRVGIAVLIASIVIALLAALAAILFSLPITRSLSRLTKATRVLAAGDYSVKVEERGPGELVELATNFNEMAAQLKEDVEELQRQEAWRRELIMNITHDLATPLTAITGLGEALSDGINQTREDYEATGQVIVRETLRLRRLVQDLHIMAKVEARALQPDKKEIRLAALVDEVLAVLIPEFERAGVEPINAIPFQLPTIQADADMLMRVFTNLCTNALRHTPANGTITIDAVQHSDWLIIAVTDTGEGIPADALARIFERFYRADNARQSSTGSSGLGLAIVRAMIEAHGGTVWAENIEDAGARISFSLPINDNSTTISNTPTFPISKKAIQDALDKPSETPIDPLSSETVRP